MKTVRSCVFPEADDTWESLAAKALPDQPVEEAVSSLQSWNLHVFARRAPTEGPRAGNPILPSDIIFFEAPFAK